MLLPLHQSPWGVQVVGGLPYLPAFGPPRRLRATFFLLPAEQEIQLGACRGAANQPQVAWPEAAASREVLLPLPYRAA